jgi:thiamine biosynthesis lipoprotein
MLRRNLNKEHRGRPARARWILALPLVPLPAVAPAPVVVERALFVMGTELRLQVEARDRTAALRASEEAVSALETVEARLSTWRADSELLRLNQAAVGERFALSAALAADLEAARRCREATQGAFDPAIGALVAAWGLRRGGLRPQHEELERAHANSGMEGLQLEGRSAIRRRSGVRVEEGGFAKGAGLAAARAALLDDPAVERAALDLGGQIVVLGNDTAWSVRLADPRDRHRPVLELVIDHGSVATSGNGERGVELGRRGRSHLLDPRSGLPVADFGSLTVWTADPLWADCLSTGLYVLGPDRALSWALRHRGVEVLVLDTRGATLEARATPGLRQRLGPLTPELEVQWVSRSIRQFVTSAHRGSTVQATPRLRTTATNRGRRVFDAIERRPFALSKRAGSHPRISTRSVHAATTSNQITGLFGLAAAGADHGAGTGWGPD